MFADPSVAAVFCLEGGYGTERLLDSLDYALIRRNPKILLGYSDITGLHLAIGRKAGLVTFHGPVAMSALPRLDARVLQEGALLVRADRRARQSAGDRPARARVSRATRSSPGTARGAIAGGNLTLISTTMGTPYEIDTKGKILFLEDTGEAPYRVDRMLVAAEARRESSRKRAGIVWGTCTDCAPSQARASRSTSRCRTSSTRSWATSASPCSPASSSGTRRRR